MRAGVTLFCLLFSLAAQELQVRPIANAGLALSCGDSTILVDSVFREGVEGYETIPPALRAAIETARPPFDKVRLILATHHHRDHFDAVAVARHLGSNPNARFAGTAQLAGPVYAIHQRNVLIVHPGDTIPFERGSVTFIRVAHNPPHRATVENSALLIRICNRTVLFTGDADQSPSDFAPVSAALNQPGAAPLDIAAVPWWFLTSRNGRQVVDSILKPKSVWAVHWSLDDRRNAVQSVRSAYPNAIIPPPVH